MNSQTDEGFTALHFASYNGNFEMIKLLLENGADMHKRNKYGSSVLHVAAQGDQALPLYYFKQEGMDINVKDNRGSTPLHWACYSRSEIALQYLLSMNPDIEAKDDQGYTPLHLAVRSVEELKSTRPVRALLLKGANRNARDNNGKKPIDLVSQGLPKSLRKDLNNILVKHMNSVISYIERPNLLGLLCH